MKITFPCHGCGRKLKARPEAAGRTRKCPVCATRVTCPTPAIAAKSIEPDVLEAEVVEAEVVSAAPLPASAARRGLTAPEPAPRPRRDPFADADDDPYQLADPAPAPEPKRPCPMCGEMILASAVKCRFCGEVFDPMLRKGKEKKKRRKSSRGGSSATGGRDIGIGLVCMAIGLGITIASFANPTSDGKGGGHFYVFYGLIIGGFIQMCRGIGALIRSDS